MVAERWRLPFSHFTLASLQVADSLDIFQCIHNGKSCRIFVRFAAQPKMGENDLFFYGKLKDKRGRRRVREERKNVNASGFP